MARLPAPRRRAELLSTAIDAMLARGFEGATTRDVAARLGIGRGLIHHYFASWKELQLTAFAELAAASQAAASGILEGLTPPERLDRLMDLLLADPAEAHWRLFADAWDAAQRDAELARVALEVATWWRETLRATLSDGVAAGRFACADCAASAWRLMALADGLSGYVLLAGSGLPRAEALTILRDAATREAGR